MNIDKLVHFEAGILHSEKKNTDYYVIYLIVSDVKLVVKFLTQAQYEQIKAKLS